MKPIISSTLMLKALLNTKPGVWPAEPIDASKPCKSQTRRVIKPQPKTQGLDYRYDGLFDGDDGNGEHYIERIDNGKPTEKYLGIGKSRYNVGDILYVRETWQENTMHSEGDRREIPYLYKADPDGVLLRSWKPSIHMPREAARLFLEVKSVRAERVQDITAADAKAEGSFLDRCECLPRKNDKTPLEKLFTQTQCMRIHGYEFKTLWNNINAKRGYSWESNPWVWVYEFARVE